MVTKGFGSYKIIICPKLKLIIQPKTLASFVSLIVINKSMNQISSCLCMLGQTLEDYCIWYCIGFSLIKRNTPGDSILICLNLTVTFELGWITIMLQPFYFSILLSFYGWLCPLYGLSVSLKNISKILKCRLVGISLCNSTTNVGWHSVNQTLKL